MKIQQLDEVEGRRTFVLVCDRGDDPVEALTAAAKRFDLASASLTGIGAFSGVTLGFFDRARRDYARRVIREQVEVVSLLGKSPSTPVSPGCTSMQWSRGTMGAPSGATSWAAPWIPRWRS